MAWVRVQVSLHLRSGVAAWRRGACATTLALRCLTDGAAVRLKWLGGGQRSWSAVCRPLALRVLVPSGVAASHLARGWGRRVQCKERAGGGGTRMLRPTEKDLQFDWTMFWEFLLPDLLLLALAVAAALVAALLNVQIPLQLGQLVNTVAALQPNQEWQVYLHQLVGPGTTLALLYCVQSVSTFVYISLLSVVGERLAVRLRTQLFRSLLQHDISFFDTHRTGELVNRLSGDVQEFKSSFKQVVSQGLRSVATVCGCSLSLLLLSPPMAAGVGVTLPLVIGAGSVFGAVLRRWSRQAQEQVAVATSVADEALSNVRTVRAFAMEEKETCLYSKELSQFQWLSERLGSGIALFQALSSLTINGIVLLVVSQGGLLLALDRITAGELMSFLVATQTIQRSLGTLSVLFGQVVRGMSAGARVFEYMAPSPSIPLMGGAAIPHNHLQGRVQFKGVHFAYPSRPEQVVLEDFTLELPPGKVTALCGLSGAGKSTVTSLLARFYDPSGGVVELDGHPLSSLDPSWLRGEVLGVISQEPVLFATSVKENIRYGRPSATDEEVYAMAELANADQFIRGFPDGYNTEVGERGVQLSGGQKQRIAIARALLKNPRVLVLDEATSALDAHSEQLVQEALDRAMEGRTVLVVAHRLSTIQEADQIAVLHRGRLQEMGTHGELVRRGGVYAELIRRQTVA